MGGLARRRERSAAKPQPPKTESWPDRIIEDWRPSVAFHMILSRHDSVCFVLMFCKKSSQAASKLKDRNRPASRSIQALPPNLRARRGVGQGIEISLK